MKSKKTLYEIVTGKVIDMLGSGVNPWSKPWTSCFLDKNGKRVLPQNLFNKIPYQGVNRFFLSLTEYNSPFYVTWNQCKKNGGQIIDNKKFHYIYHFRWVRYEEEDKSGEKKEKFRPSFRYYLLYNVENTTGLEHMIPKLLVASKSEEFSQIEEAEKVIEDMPNPPEIKHGGERACYHPLKDLVKIPIKKSFNNEADYYSVLFHELGHSTGHEKRLDRKGYALNLFGDHSYSKEELVAEMTAAFLSEYCGFSNRTINNSASYLQGWINVLKGDSQLIVRAASKAERAAEFILGNIRTAVEEETVPDAA